MGTKGYLKAIPILALAAFAPAPSWAQHDSDSWQWRARVYAWLPDLEAKTEFPSGGGPTLDVDASTLVDNLDFTFQAGLQVRKGAWGVFTDVIYMDEGASRSGVRDIALGPSALPSDVSYDLAYGFGWGEVVAAWRYLDYGLPGDSVVTELNFNGPLVGVAFDW